MGTSEMKKNLFALKGKLVGNWPTVRLPLESFKEVRS